MGKSFEASTVDIPENFGQDSLFSMSSRKIRTELAWRDSVSLESGIEEMIRWISDDWNVIAGLPLDYIHKE
jgi:dTDP-glucose 4,6-dehydratase